MKDTYLSVYLLQVLCIYLENDGYVHVKTFNTTNMLLK